MSYTNGPWHKNTVENGKPKVFGNDNFYCVINGDKRESNAHLIASAPDLLEACKVALDTLEKMTTADFEIGHDRLIRDMLKTAIAKAEGRE